LFGQRHLPLTGVQCRSPVCRSGILWRLSVWLSHWTQQY